MRGFHAGAHLLRVGLALATALLLGTVATVGRSGQTPTSEPEAGAASSDPGSEVDRSGQPIAFSHAHHVAEVGLDCQHCHVYARRGPVAGIPSVQTCVGCHQQVLTDRPEVQKILEYWEAEQPIPWIRVHDLPDYTRFSHKRHVLGGVDCGECHGPVDQMEIAVQVESLSMGWCVTCHEARGASRDCLTCHY